MLNVSNAWEGGREGGRERERCKRGFRAKEVYGVGWSLGVKVSLVMLWFCLQRSSFPQQGMLMVQTYDEHFA